MNVLLVDDEDQFRTAVARQLTVRGYTVHEAGTGEQGIAIAQETRLDLVILDMRLPGINGTATLKEIKRISPLTEVIMLTGQATVKAAMEAITLGAFDYMTKPMGIDELIYKMEDAYKKRQLATQKIKATGPLDKKQ
ncbi:two-component system response regulator (Ntr family protein) [Desulforapulum autotrophicum HRM2]|uniref:Two-component system response regulator (Ntr family protein) n=1 Tax=Desulforapulum autotrophicum (strain ATCC 43914 / DSM 3382 / VKM B-1955 / HRM2) TaxID=177437 RepID=C0QAT9_DESAH|nr:response regulator [Desulforapulum autotrophicum]ACN16872.1 two-component system response regulator (Ntr family protein) [Desulforapulum autotrophicum HRM2]